MAPLEAQVLVVQLEVKVILGELVSLDQMVQMVRLDNREQRDYKDSRVFQE